jgi:hypothetical protein
LVACDVIFVALRAESFSEELLSTLDGADCPVISVSPLVSDAELERWRRVRNFVAATPNLVAAFRADQLEYWVPPFQVTRLDVSGKRWPAVIELATCLRRGGIPTRFEQNVQARSRSTLLAFVPLQYALLAKPEIAAWRADGPFRQRVALALAVGRRAALHLGSLDLQLRLATWLLCRSWTLWLASLLLPLCVPDLARFLGSHFGHKLEAQTQMFGANLSREAARYGLTQADVRAMLLEPLGPLRS